MAIKTFFINSTVATYNDEEFAWFQSLMLNEGIIGLPSAGTLGLQVIQNGTPDMSVLVGTGKALVELVKSGRTFKVVVNNDTQVQVTIPANASGVNRVDAIIVRVDKDVDPNVSKTNVSTIERVAGTGITALTDGAIDTAVGSDGWYRLANVTVTNGDVAIITAEIADTRIRVAANSAFDIQNSVPIASVHEFAGTVAPTGYLMCDGAAVSRTTYASLFAIIASNFGGGDGTTTFNLPDRRAKFGYGLLSSNKVVVDDCEDAWNEFTAANVTSSLDAAVFMTGAGSAKISVGSAVIANTLLATEVITSVNLRTRTHLHLWIRSTVAAASGDLQILLDDSASCATPVYTLNVPALAANVWTRVSLPMTHPVTTDVSMISLGIKMVTDLGAFDINIDDVCVGNGFEIGLGGGEVEHGLTVSELAAHTHGYYRSNGGSGVTAVTSAASNTGDPGGNAIFNTGGNLGHNNIPPLLTMNYIIKF